MATAYASIELAVDAMLSDYLWKNGQVPPTRTLTIRNLDRDELPIAERWQA